MPSRATSVGAYLGELAPERRLAVERILEIARKELKGFGEGIEFGMPFFRRSPELSVGVASQKQYVAIYVGDQVVSAFRSRLGGASLGKGCVRFTRPEKIDFDVIAAIFQAVAARKSNRYGSKAE